MRNRKNIPRRVSGRRGVAMLLVLVALSTATILTVSYVGSRDNTGQIATNVRQATDANWAAASGASLAVAILQTGADWGSDADAAKLVEEVFGGGVHIHTRVTDFDGNPADADDRDVLVTTTATSGGVTATREQAVSLRPKASIADGLDPEMFEYALYCSNSIRLDSGSLIGVWSLSPGSDRGNPVKLGFGFGTTSTVQINSSASTVNTALYVPAAASESLRAMVKDARFVGGGEIPYEVPVMASDTPSALTSLMWRSIFNATHSGSGTAVNIQSGTHQDVTVRHHAVATLGAWGGGDFNIDDLTIEHSGVLRIVGDVRLRVRGDLTVSSYGAIEFADENATLRIYLQGNAMIDDSAIGVTRDVARNSARTLASVTDYSKPSRLRLYTTGSSHAITLRNSAIAVASVHAPYGNLDLQSNSTLLGRATVTGARVRSGSSLLYDASMDNRLGWTSFDGPLYERNGGPIAELTSALASLSASLGLGSLLSGVVDALGVLALSPEDTAPDAQGVTYRDADLAVAKAWPTTVFTLEQHETLSLMPQMIGLQPGGIGGIGFGTIGTSDTVAAGETTDIESK